MPIPLTKESSLFSSIYFRHVPTEEDPQALVLTACVKIEMDRGPCEDVFVPIAEADKKTVLDLLVKYRDAAIGEL